MVASSFAHGHGSVDAAFDTVRNTIAPALDVSGFQEEGFRVPRVSAGVVAPCPCIPNSDMSAMGAWQASLEFEMDLARLVEKEKGHSISEADQAAEKVLNIFSSRHVLDTIGRAGPGLSSPTIKAPLHGPESSHSVGFSPINLGPSLPGGLSTGGHYTAVSCA